jgi:hypothetical protein
MYFNFIDEGEITPSIVQKVSNKKLKFTRIWKNLDVKFFIYNYVLRI